jgi:hypothetical protein
MSRVTALPMYPLRPVRSRCGEVELRTPAGVAFVGGSYPPLCELLRRPGASGGDRPLAFGLPPVHSAGTVFPTAHRGGVRHGSRLGRRRHGGVGRSRPHGGFDLPALLTAGRRAAGHADRLRPVLSGVPATARLRPARLSGLPGRNTGTPETVTRPARNVARRFGWRTFA